MQNNDQREIIVNLLFVVSFIIAFILMLVFFPAPNGRTYDCSLSEISPDIPIQVKNECRKLRAEMASKNLKEPK